MYPLASGINAPSRCRAPTPLPDQGTYRAIQQEANFKTDGVGCFILWNEKWTPINFMVGGLYQDTRRDFMQYVFNAGRNNPDVPDSTYRYANFVKKSFTDGETRALFG